MTTKAWSRTHQLCLLFIFGLSLVQAACTPKNIDQSDPYATLSSAVPVTVTPAAATAPAVPAQIPAAIVITNNSGTQTAVVHTNVTLSANITDVAGLPINNQQVDWVVTDGGDGQIAASTSTDASGNAVTTLTLGTCGHEHCHRHHPRHRSERQLSCTHVDTRRACADCFHSRFSG